MTYFPVGSIDAQNVAKINKLLNEYEENFVALPDVKVIDLTGDDVQKEQELHDLKQKAVVTSKALQKSLADIVFNEEQSIKYKKEADAEKKKLAQELSESNKANEELKEENQKLLNLQDGAQSKMQKLAELEERRKVEQFPVDIFQSLPDGKYQKEDGKVGFFGVHNVKEMEMEDKRKKQAKETASQQKEYKRLRNIALEVSAKRRKLNTGLAEEFRNVDRSRKTLQYTEAIPLTKKSRGNKSCGAACESIKDENYYLKEQEQLATVASALAFRQLLCAQAFCNYSMHFLYKSDFKSRQKMYKFLYEILPRYITAFTKCTSEMGTVRKILAEKEVRAWYSFNGMIPSQNLAYLYCQDMLSVKTTDAKDLNLCETCDKHTASSSVKGQ